MDPLNLQRNTEKNHIKTDNKTQLTVKKKSTEIGQLVVKSHNNELNPMVLHGKAAHIEFNTP